MRILLGLTEVSGHYASLKEGFRELGISATYWNFSGHPFAYGHEDGGPLIRLLQWSAHLQKNGLPPLHWFGALLHAGLRFLLFFYALARFDVFLFGFNTSFFRYWDLPILKFFGKKIIYQFHGSDSRPPYLDGSLFPEGRSFPVEECIALTKAKKRAIRIIEHCADVVVDNPTGGHFHEKPFVIWLHVGLTSPAAFMPWTQAPDCREGRAIRILHCPSNPAAKGTAHIEMAVNHLKLKGWEFEYTKLTGRPNTEVLDELARCDVVVDQAYSDYAMPGFATEAAWLGKPVIIGGYASDLWPQLMSRAELPPTVFCHPHQMEGALEHLLGDLDLCRELGLEARRFVETHWSPAQVARNYLRLLKQDIPKAWWFDPKQTTYLSGVCAAEKWIREMVRQVIANGGLEALQLEDKPDLEKAILFSLSDTFPYVGRPAA